VTGGSSSSSIVCFLRFYRRSASETLVRWHRAGFRCYWHWKSRRRGGRPQIDAELRGLIAQMSAENPLWGAPRIHGELLKLGFEVAQSTVAKHMRRRRGPPGQSWWTFLRNHAPEVAAMDLFVVPTVAFRLLYGLVIVRLDRRELVRIAVTSSPTAERIARQITEAFSWDSAPGYLIRDRDRAFGPVVRHRLRAMVSLPQIPSAWSERPNRAMNTGCSSFSICSGGSSWTSSGRGVRSKER
jgi:hypothetical protein